MTADAKHTQPKSIYEFEVTRNNGKAESLSVYKGKVLLIVNVASKCGFTKQYKGLQELYDKYKDQGFVVLGFPSNQFGGQEPGSDKEIQEFCQLNFGVNFPLFKKGDVRGKSKQPLFEFLTEQANKSHSGAIRWNFEKFLIDRNGQLVNRFRSLTKPESKSLNTQITKCLDKEL